MTLIVVGSSLMVLTTMIPTWTPNTGSEPDNGDDYDYGDADSDSDDEDDTTTHGYVVSIQQRPRTHNSTEDIQEFGSQNLTLTIVKNWNQPAWDEPVIWISAALCIIGVIIILIFIAHWCNARCQARRQV